ncbi:hypothetical protein V6Z11_A08G274700 [Gossypium hirsutum]
MFERRIGSCILGGEPVKGEGNERRKEMDVLRQLCLSALSEGCMTDHL